MFSCVHCEKDCFYVKLNIVISKYKIYVQLKKLIEHGLELTREKKGRVVFFV